MAKKPDIILSAVLQKMVGKKAWGTIIGPWGVHVHFRNLHANKNPRLRPHGDYSTWVRGGIRVTNKRNTFFESGPYPEESLEKALAVLIDGREVSGADFDQAKNALRIILDQEILFSAYPASDGKYEYPWIIYDHLTNPVTYWVVDTKSLKMG